jgi:hypothetical protein
MLPREDEDLFTPLLQGKLRQISLRQQITTWLQHASNVRMTILSGSFPAFFLPIATTSKKNFESEATVNWKCRC